MIVSIVKVAWVTLEDKAESQGLEFRWQTFEHLFHMVWHRLDRHQRTYSLLVSSVCVVVEGNLTDSEVHRGMAIVATC